MLQLLLPLGIIGFLACDNPDQRSRNPDSEALRGQPLASTGPDPVSGSTEGNGAGQRAESSNQAGIEPSTGQSPNSGASSTSNPISTPGPDLTPIEPPSSFTEPNLPTSELEPREPEDNATEDPNVRPTDLLQVAKAGNFETLREAVELAGLVEALQQPGPFTLFAPDDAAFDRLNQATLKDLLDDPQQLAGVLLYHVVSGIYSQEKLEDTETIEALQGGMLSIESDGHEWYVNGVRIKAGPVEASNGVIYVLEDVLLP